MECGCSCDIDYEGRKCGSSDWVKGRKEYTCCECGGDIAKGERHHVSKGLWDESWDCFRTCKPCYDIRADMCPGGYVFGTLREVVWDCLGVDYVTGAIHE